MTHVATCTTINEAWNILKNQYQSLGIAARTMLRNRFTSLRMSEADNLEFHIKELRKIFNNLNIALLAESSAPYKEIEFVRQLLSSLPESWQILVSVIPQRPESNDKDGTKLSADIQSRLLAEFHRRESQLTEKAFYANNRNSYNRSHGRSEFSPANRSDIICHNCGISGHTRPVCRKPGGGAYRGRNSRASQDQDWRNEDQDNDDQNNNFGDNNPLFNDNNRDQQRANYASQVHFAYSFSFRLITHSISPKLEVMIPDSPIHSHSADIFPEVFPDLSSIDSFPPIFGFEEPEDPVQAFAPSEGEIETILHILDQAPTAESFTRHEDSHSTVDPTQGEHPIVADADVLVTPAAIAASIAIKNAIKPIIESTVEPTPIAPSIAVESTIEPTIEPSAEPTVSGDTYSFIDIIGHILVYILFWSFCYRFCDAISTILVLIQVYNIISAHRCALTHYAHVVTNTAHIWLTCYNNHSIRNTVSSIADLVLRHRLSSIARESLKMAHTRITRLFRCYSFISTSLPVSCDPFSLANSIDLYSFSRYSSRDLVDAHFICDHLEFIKSFHNFASIFHFTPNGLSTNHIRGISHIDFNSVVFISTSFNLVDRLKLHVADLLA